MDSTWPPGPHGTEIALSLANSLFLSVRHCPCYAGACPVARLWARGHSDNWGVNAVPIINWGCRPAAYFQAQAVNASLIEGLEAVWVSLPQRDRQSQVSHHQSLETRGEPELDSTRLKTNLHLREIFIEREWSTMGVGMTFFLQIVTYQSGCGSKHILFQAVSHCSEYVWKGLWKVKVLVVSNSLQPYRL